MNFFFLYFLFEIFTFIHLIIHQMGGYENISFIFLTCLVYGFSFFFWKFWKKFDFIVVFWRKTRKSFTCVMILVYWLIDWISNQSMKSIDVSNHDNNDAFNWVIKLHFIACCWLLIVDYCSVLSSWFLSFFIDWSIINQMIIDDNYR